MQVSAAPALTVVVKDAVLKKPIQGALVSVDSSQDYTDSTGTATFPTLSAGNYTISVSSGPYISKSVGVTLTEAGQIVEVELIPVILVAAAVVVAAGAGIAAVSTIVLRRR